MNYHAPTGAVSIDIDRNSAYLLACLLFIRYNTACLGWNYAISHLLLELNSCLLWQSISHLFWKPASHLFMRVNPPVCAVNITPLNICRNIYIAVTLLCVSVLLFLLQEVEVINNVQDLLRKTIRESDMQIK